MNSDVKKREARLKRKRRIRTRIKGTQSRPRLCIFRSAKHVYAQIIDDISGHTVVAASTYEKQVKDKSDFENKIAASHFIGKLVGERAKDKGIQEVVFDRNGFLYHGRVKAIAEGAREAGLQF